MIEFDSANVEKALAELGARGKRAAAAGAFAGMTRLLERAAPLVPQKSGRLVGSAFVSVVDGDGVVVGGYSDPKAAAVHEIQATHTVGETKFLEKAVNAFADEAVGVVVAAFVASLESGAEPAAVFPLTPLQIPED